MIIISKPSAWLLTANSICRNLTPQQLRRVIIQINVQFIRLMFEIHKYAWKTINSLPDN